MPARVSIRPALAADVPSLLALVREYWAFEGIDGFDETRAEHAPRRLFDNPALGCAWIARDASTPVGYLLACYVFSLEQGGLTAEIDEFFVKPGHRGTGLGRRLLRTAEQAFAAAGCARVALQLGRGNDAARAFYGRCGYRARDGYELMDKGLSPSAAPRLPRV